MRVYNFSINEALRGKTLFLRLTMYIIGEIIYTDFS